MALGERPRLQPFKPPQTFPPRASKLFGREEQGGQLLALVREHSRVAVTGDGGLGKTALAAEVLRRLHDGGGGEWFAGGLFLHDFYQQPTFGAFVETILVHAGQSGRSADEQIALAAEVLKRPATFVYLEGTEKLGDGLPAVLRLLDGHTRLLLTTREPGQAAGMPRLALHPIDLVAAARAVHHYMQKNRADSSQPPLPVAEDDAAWHDLARDMGGHALGCKLAGELCGELAIAPAELHERLAEQGLKTLAVGGSSKDNLDVLFRQSALALCPGGVPSLSPTSHWLVATRDC